jgi:hypothetical protein
MRYDIRMRKNEITLIALILLASTGCASSGEHEEDEDDEGALATVDTSVCLSGQQWQGGNEESTLMHPGMSCIGCHAAEGEGPSYAIAGTVYGDYDEPNDCGGVSGVIIEITGGDGTVFELESNAAGNFRLRESQADALVLPYTARVVDGANVRAMAAAQTSGDCASCHTSTGASGAPGRIVAP